MELILFTCLICLLITLIYFYLKRYYTTTYHDLPGDKPQILFGNLLNSGLLTGRMTFHEIMHEYQDRYGDKFVYWFGPEPFITFCLPEHAQLILSDRQNFDQSPLFVPNFDLICPSGLIIISGAKWKRHARIMIPAFKRARMIQHLDTIIECTDRFIDQCLKNNQIHTDLVQRCQTLTMNVIGLIGFDYDLESSMDSSLKTAFHDFVSYASLVMLMAWLPRWFNKLYLKWNWRYQRMLRLLRELVEKILEQEQNNQNTAETEVQQRPKNLIASLITSLNDEANDEQISSGITREEMFDEALTAIVAGFETTSTALAWFIFYASKNPQIQQRIKDELQEHNLLMTDDIQCLPPLTQEKLDALTYCECVTKEVLRLAPVAGATSRIALSDTTVDNVFIRRGQTVIIGLHNVNTDSRYWHHDDPMKFIPERFLGKDEHHHPYAMLPFGGGHRSCLGQDLARLELKLIIVRLMQRGITFEDTPENIGGYAERIACFPKTMAVRVRMDLGQQ